MTRASACLKASGARPIQLPMRTESGIGYAVRWGYDFKRTWMFRWQAVLALKLGRVP